MRNIAAKVSSCRNATLFRLLSNGYFPT